MSVPRLLRRLAPILCLLSPLALAQQPAMHGAAAPGAVVQRGHVRFEVLTPRLIRMQWSSDGHFENAPSLVFVDRRQPVPQYTVSDKGGVLHIRTTDLTLSYREGSGRFDAANLHIASHGLTPAFDWHPGMAETGNLAGTARTLDGFNGDRNQDTGKRIDLGQGLLSRQGWHVVDDSGSYVFDDSPWPWARARHCKDCQDLYFFGYGHEYEKALGDFAAVAGREPLPPRFAFGYWWSRYWNYSDSELRALVGKFHTYRIPLDVLVIDMDWHRTDGLSFNPKYAKTDSAGQLVGWTGYTWNRSLFPDPPRLLHWLGSQHLMTTLNLHPASGMQPREAKYPQFARAMGVTDGKAIPFESASKRYMRTLFDVVLDPLRAEGVDFWWLDWQQWPDSKKLKHLSNTWWLNYVFFTHMQRATDKRALIYHRWGGLGDHRYQVGFSGDSVISWKTLAFQPYFTATASNVLYGYWSHDLGGHMFPKGTPKSKQFENPELYVRWMQFGAFSPIMRTHSSKDASLRKEPWRFPPADFDALRDAIDLRYTLDPYIYSMARKAYDTGVSLLRPMYYRWPDAPQAYAYKHQYMFGDDMLVAPVTAPMHDGLATVKLWLPPGRWYDRNAGRVIDGGRVIERHYTLDEIPVFVRAGTVVPTYGPEVHNLQAQVGHVVLRVYPGGKGHFRLYEDNGDSQAYRHGSYAFTAIDAQRDAHHVRVHIDARKGHFKGMLADKRWSVDLPASVMPTRVRVDGHALKQNADGHPGSWHLDGKHLMLHVDLKSRPAGHAVTVTVSYPADAPDVNGLLYRMKRVRRAVAWLKNHWDQVGPLPDDVSLAAQAGLLIDYHPQQFAHQVAAFRQRLGKLVDEVNATHAPADSKKRFAAMIDAAQKNG